MHKNDTAAVILASGKSTRFKYGKKQFARLAGKPVFSYSLKELSRHSSIDIIVLVVPKKNVSDISRAFAGKQNKVKVITGGGTRQQSIMNALLFLNDLRITPKFVLFHDAARPFISQAMISSVIEVAQRFGGGVIGKQATDLTLEVTNGNIKKALRKNLTYSGYTPQCFKFKPLLHAHQRYLKSRFTEKDYSFDNIELLLKYRPGFKIKVVDTSFPSHKITFAHDLEVAMVLLKYFTR